MKKMIVFIVILLLFIGCNGSETPSESNENLTILTPRGSAGLSLLDYFVNVDARAITFVDGTDVLSAELISASSGYDVIIAPINLGVRIIEQGNSEYRLLGVITWGNLFLIQNDDLLESNLPVALFGEGAVPQRVLESVVDLAQFERDIIFLPGVTEVQAYVLTERAAIALLAEPALSATLARAQADGINLSVIMNLQEEWSSVTGYHNYPQAAIFVRESSFNNNSLAFEQLITALERVSTFSTTPEIVIEYLSGNEEIFGVGNANIIASAWNGMSINFIYASEVVSEIETFLNLFGISVNSDLFIN